MHKSIGKASIQARRHPFAGAVLTQQHARELTPTLVLLIVQALSEKILESSSSQLPSTQPNVADSPRSGFSSASGDVLYRPNKLKVQYTVCTFPFDSFETHSAVEYENYDNFIFVLVH